MTISSTTRKAGPFSGNGVTTVFPFSFKVFDKTDVKVLRAPADGDATTLTLDSDYSVTLNSNQDSNPGGMVTYPLAGTPLPAGYVVVILGALDALQPTDITNSGGFYPQTIEDMVDRTVILIQQVAEVASRAIVVTEIEDTAPVLPAASARAGFLLGFDALGAVEMMPITASVGAGDLHDDVLVAGTDFIAGTSMAVTLSRAYSTLANIVVHFDGVYQGPDQIASLVGNTLTFAAAIPLGTARVYVKGGTTLSLEIPPDGSITDAKIASNTIIWNRLNNIVDVNDFNKSGTKASYAFTAAAAKLAALGGGEIFVPPGSYMFDTPVDIPGNVRVRGAGFGAVLVASGALSYLLGAKAGSSQSFDNLQFNGNGYLAGDGIQVNGAAFVNATRCLFTGLASNAFNMQDNGAIIDGPTLRDCVFLNNKTAIYFQGGVVNGVIAGMYQEGGDGIVIDTDINHCEGTMIVTPLIKPSILNGSQGIGITFNGGLESQIIGGVIDQVQLHGIVLNGASSGVVKTKIIGTWVGHRGAPSANGIGLLAQGQVNDLNLIGMTAAVSPTFGMQFQAAGANTPDEVLMDGCMFLNNTTGDVFNNGTAGHYKIKNNKFQHPTNNYQEGSNSIAADIDGNTFKAVPNSISTASRMGKNYGLTTRNHGTATIPSGTTSVSVNHGLSFTPRFDQINLRQAGIPTTAIGDVSLSSIDAAQFTIRVRTDPGATGVTFAWQACTEQ